MLLAFQKNGSADCLFLNLNVSISAVPIFFFFFCSSFYSLRFTIHHHLPLCCCHHFVFMLIETENACQCTLFSFYFFLLHLTFFFSNPLMPKPNCIFFFLFFCLPKDFPSIQQTAHEISTSTRSEKKL